MDGDPGNGRPVIPMEVVILLAFTDVNVGVEIRDWERERDDKLDG